MIVTVERLNRFMSSPEWTNDQTLAAEDILAGVESTLEAALYDAPISPRAARTETAPILASGQVATRYPVHTLLGVNGVAVDDAHPIVAPWTLSENRLRCDAASIEYFSSASLVAHVGSVGAVSVTYQPGWGDVPALRLAIMRKAKTLMINAHDDTMVARAIDATKPPPMPPEDWTDKELGPLGIYRNLTAWR